VFHAGTDLRGGQLVSAGGRVLTICATGPDLAAARESAYLGIAAIDYPNGIFRRDIGVRALSRHAGD
jgi:phosphoribosylamine--glycine ligase